MCDDHPDSPAVKRVQGDTDSFGCEYFYMCQECYDAYRKSMQEPRMQFCDGCKVEKSGVKPIRDPDEGQSGPVYYLCGGCRTAFVLHLIDNDPDDDPDDSDDEWDD